MWDLSLQCVGPSSLQGTSSGTPFIRSTVSATGPPRKSSQGSSCEVSVLCCPSAVTPLENMSSVTPVSDEAAWPLPVRVNRVLVFRVSTLKTEFLPLLSVSFVSENSVVAAVSIYLIFPHVPCVSFLRPEQAVH